MIINITLKTEEENPSFDKLLDCTEKRGWELVNLGAEKVTIIQESGKK